jgi:hypothetical protein
MCREPSKDKRDRSHVVDLLCSSSTISLTSVVGTTSIRPTHRVVTVSKVVKRAGFVDDPDRGLLCADLDLLDVVGRLAQGLELVVEDEGSLDGRLSVKFGGRGDLSPSLPARTGIQ